MKHLTKEQEQEIWDKVSKEVENLDTFLDKSKCIDEISNKVKSISKGMMQFSSTTFNEMLARIKGITYELIGTKEIQATLGEYFSIQYNSNTFCIMPKPKIQPYDENQQDSKDLQKQDMCPISCCDLSILFRKYPLLFMNCVFQCENLNTHFIENLNKLCFIQCEFKGKITLTFKECLDVFLMSHCTFEKPLTIHGKFKENADFNNSIFQDSVDFSQCEFEKTANFYGVEFKKVPNFSQTQFKGSLNVVNTNLDFGFESLKEKIKQEYRQQNKNSKKSLAHFANDFRDSFRVLKNVLIRENNLFEAQKYHKMELYCRELELRDILEQKKSKRRLEKINDANNVNYKVWLEGLLLLVYRYTSDHHTNLARIINVTASMIGLYGLFLYGCNLCLSFAIVQGFEYYLIVTCFAICALLIFGLFKKVNSLYKTLMQVLAVCMLVLSCAFVFIVAELEMYYFIFVILAFLMYMVLLTSYCVSLGLKRWVSNIVHTFTYVCFFIVLIVLPQFINPFGGIFKSDSMYNALPFEKQLHKLIPRQIIGIAHALSNQTRFDCHTLSGADIDQAKQIIRDYKESILKTSFLYTQQDLMNTSRMPRDLNEAMLKDLGMINAIKIIHIIHSVIPRQLIGIAHALSNQTRFDCHTLSGADIDQAKQIIRDYKESILKTSFLYTQQDLMNTSRMPRDLNEAMLKDLIMISTTKTTSIIYSIILLLCVFSLQKTARKNSIVPN